MEGAAFAGLGGARRLGSRGARPVRCAAAKGGAAGRRKGGKQKARASRKNNVQGALLATDLGLVEEKEVAKPAPSSSHSAMEDLIEAEKTLLLEEREQLESLLEQIRVLEVEKCELDSEGEGEEDDLEPTSSGSTREDDSGNLAEASGGGAKAAAPVSPRASRFSRYRASRLRRTPADLPGAAEPPASSEEAGERTEESASPTIAPGSARAELGSTSSFVSTSSAETLSTTPASSSGDVVTRLLQERRHLSLLTREQEADLIEQAQFCFAVERAITELEQIHGKHPTYEQLAMAVDFPARARGDGRRGGKVTAASLKRRHAEAMEARTFMLDHNVRLVVHLAHRYTGKGVSLGDLVQEGIQGLLTALEKFDLSRNLKFSTYATWWIKQSLIRGVCNYSRDVRLPVHITDTLQKMSKIQREGLEGGKGSGASGGGGQQLTPEQLARVMGVKVDKVRAVLESTRSAIPLEVLCAGGSDSGGGPTGNGAGGDPAFSSSGTPAAAAPIAGGAPSSAVEDILALPMGDERSPGLPGAAGSDVGDSLDSELYETVLREDVDAVLRMLPPRERNILRMRFGLTPVDDMCLSLVEIGAAYGLTRERVRQMEARALNKLRQPKLSTKLRKYVEPETLLFTSRK